MITPSELLMKLKNDRQQEAQTKANKRQEILNKNREDSRLLKALNRKNAEEIDTVGGAIAHGLIAGIGEGFTEAAGDFEAAEEYVKWLGDYAAAMGQQEANNEAVRGWFDKNYQGIGKFVSQLPNMTSEQAKRLYNRI